MKKTPPRDLPKEEVCKISAKSDHFWSLQPAPKFFVHRQTDTQISLNGHREIPQNTKIRILRQTKIFREKPLQPFFREPCPLSLCQKSEKTNEAILHKVQKTLFLGSFWPKFAQKKFFSKIGLRHILGITILHHCAKNQKKLMSQSREKLVTDERTNERTQVNL